MAGYPCCCPKPIPTVPLRDCLNRPCPTTYRLTVARVQAAECGDVGAINGQFILQDRNVSLEFVTLCGEQVQGSCPWAFPRDPDFGFPWQCQGDDVLLRWLLLARWSNAAGGWLLQVNLRPPAGGVQPRISWCQVVDQDCRVFDVTYTADNIEENRFFFDPDFPLLDFRDATVHLAVLEP